MSPDGSLIASASADRTVWIWDAITGAPRFRLPGHKGAVNDVSFHPFEPVIASAGTDKRVIIGEI